LSLAGVAAPAALMRPKSEGARAAFKLLSSLRFSTICLNKKIGRIIFCYLFYYQRKMKHKL
jgi:hypothetical protein